MTAGVCLGAAVRRAADMERGVEEDFVRSFAVVVVQNLCAHQLAYSPQITRRTDTHMTRLWNKSKEHVDMLRRVAANKTKLKQVSGTSALMAGFALGEKDSEATYITDNLTC